MPNFKAPGANFTVSATTFAFPGWYSK
ncbi:hypothetical protein A2U01_0111533, partial [Trifolium medium]|nr:hypothetical protein [Trifolium medium]